MNIQTTLSEKTLVVKNLLNGSVLTISFDDKNKVVVSRETSCKKDDQYGTYINKHIKEVVVKHMPKRLSYKDRLKKVQEIINKHNTATSFRMLSNQMRKSMNNGVYYPIGTYFYEGMRKSS